MEWRILAYKDQAGFAEEAISWIQICTIDYIMPQTLIKRVTATSRSPKVYLLLESLWPLNLVHVLQKASSAKTKEVGKHCY